MGIKSKSLFENLRRETYFIRYLNGILRADSALFDLAEELITDCHTVFICGGFASYIAGLTVGYGDIDYFCTSRSAFCDIVNLLDRKEKITNDIIKGEYKNILVNVIYNSNAIMVEDFLDGFDITWSRVAIDFSDRTIVIHPLATDKRPVFDSNCFDPKNRAGDSRGLVDRTYQRYTKYNDRRIIKCDLEDCEVAQEIAMNIAQIRQTPIVMAQQSSKTIAHTHY